MKPTGKLSNRVPVVLGGTFPISGLLRPLTLRRRIIIERNRREHASFGTDSLVHADLGVNRWSLLSNQNESW